MRRAKRLLPALTVVIMTTLIAGCSFLFRRVKQPRKACVWCHNLRIQHFPLRRAWLFRHRVRVKTRCTYGALPLRSNIIWFGRYFCSLLADQERTSRRLLLHATLVAGIQLSFGRMTQQRRFFCCNFVHGNCFSVLASQQSFSIWAKNHIMLIHTDGQD